MDASRISGLVSGFDTENKVKELMAAHRHRLNSVEKDKTWVEWQQEEYRGVVNQINSFQSTYFDTLNSSNNLRSPSAFAEYSSSVSLNGAPTSAVTVEGEADISDFDHTISEISQLATSDTWRGDEVITSVDGAGLDVGALNTSITNGNDTIGITVNGDTQEIALNGGYADSADVAADLQNQIDTTFGAGVIAVSETGGEIRLDPGDGQSVRMLAVDDAVLNDLGFTSGDKNYIETDSRMYEEFGLAEGQDISFSINGTDFTFSSDDRVSTMMETVNSSAAGVNLSYNTLENRFTMVSDDTGVSSSIELTDTDNFFADQLNISGSTTAGQNAVFTLDGVSTTRSSNSFSIDDVRYNLHETYDGSQGDIDITINTDSDAIVDKIKDFVDVYNGLIKDIDEKTSERRSFEYKPLSTDERKSMEEDEIELWEEKARKGLLGSDSQLQDMTTKMRRALSDAVEGVGISLSDIGITTSSNYLERGRLSVDEDKLRTALSDDYNQVVSLFSKSSDIRYTEYDKRSDRMQEQGLAERMNDIMQDYTRTRRDNNGRKGILVERAGVEGDGSIINNSLTKKIQTFDERMARIEDHLADKEQHYYKMFAAMEKAMSEMQSQAGPLMNMGGGQGGF
ncbi:MAG: flagellar filament capping protein FliD [Fibrobacterota bacterium]